MDKKKARLIKLLKIFKNNVNKKIKIDKLILFGSQATDKARKDSDVDLLFISEEFKGKKYFKRSPEFYLMWNYDYNVDIICLTPKEVIKRKKEIGIIKEAITNGIEI